MEHISNLLRIKVLSGGIRAAGKSSSDNKEGSDYNLRGERATDKMTRIKIQWKKPDITLCHILANFGLCKNTIPLHMAVLHCYLRGLIINSHIFKNLVGAAF